MRDPRFHAPRRIDASQPHMEEEVEQAWHKGQAVALAAPSLESIDAAHAELMHAPREVWAAFFDGFAAGTAENTRQHEWSELLQDKVRTFWGTPVAINRSADRQDHAIVNRARAWREAKSPFLAWRAHGFAGELDAAYYLALLLQADPRAWCNAIDGLPSPHVMGAALYFYVALREDRDAIERLLRLAPPAFDEQWRWVKSRSVVALLLAELIVEHAEALHAAVSSRAASPDAADDHGAELQHLETVELPAWMRHAFGVLLDRSDGAPSGLGLLGYLASEKITGESQYPEGAWSAQAQATQILAEMLTERGIGVHDARRVWTATAGIERDHFTDTELVVESREPDTYQIPEYIGEGARTLRVEGFPLLFGATILMGQEPGADDVEAFWHWFEELLIGRDPGLPMQPITTAADVAHRFGLLLSRARSPASLFRRTYIKLEPLRRRALFAYRYADHHDNLGSLLLLYVGLYAADSWTAREKTTSDADATGPQALFWWIYEAARRLWLTGPPDVARDRREIVPTCLAFMPRLFGDTLGEALLRAVPLISNEPDMVAAAGWYLWKNGVQLDRLVELLRGAGADLEQALRDTYQWAKLTETRSRWQQGPDFPSSLHDLARAIEISLDEQPVAPPRDDLSRGRAELSRSIPWGAALLHRLEEDACTPLRLTPLDPRATTWLLQAALPPPLTSRFGLSPELRILIVYGQVRGRDLRTALQDPAGAERVDPDLIVVAGDQPELVRRVPMLAGPWGQRVPWPPMNGQLAPLADALREHLPAFDLFDYRDPVRGSALVGRHAQIDDITARLLRGEAVGVVGLRKVGKSSLLRAVAERIDPIGARSGMFESLTVPVPAEAEPEALVVSLDVQGVPGRSLSVLLDRLCTALEDRLALAGMKAEEAPRPEAMDPVERLRWLLGFALSHTKLPLCFLLDEYDLLFEGYNGEPGIPGIDRLLALLRAEAQSTGRVSLALIGRDPVFLERPLLGGFTNPLAGWARPLFLGPLRRDEADELLTRLGRRMDLDMGPATLETAWRWTGGHPLLLRQYGSSLFELAYTPPSRSRPVPTDPIHDEAVESFVLRDAVHTISVEIQHLLDLRFPAALVLLIELASAPEVQGGSIVERHGGPRAPSMNVLLRFGLIGDEPTRPRLPEILRQELAIYSHSDDRSESIG